MAGLGVQREQGQVHRAAQSQGNLHTRLERSREGGREGGRPLMIALSTSLRRIIIVNCPGRIEMDIMEDNEAGGDGSDHDSQILFISFC